MGHATGRSIDDYARDHRFTPLGIADFHWKKTPAGHPDTEGGLYRVYWRLFSAQARATFAA